MWRDATGILLALILITPPQGSAMSDESVLEKTSLAALLPNSFDGWQVAGEDRFFDPQTIFDYIDGSGEVYRAYNFRLLLARSFAKPGQPPITIDLFDMGSSQDAFGVFTHNLDGEDVGIGQGSRYLGGLLSAWKGRCFISVFADEENAESRAAVIGAGRAIAAAIQAEGEMPAILGLLPDGAAADGTRYFHTYEILNYHYFVSATNILLLDARTEAVLAPLQGAGGEGRVLLVKYADPAAAARALGDFSKGYMPDAGPGGTVRTENGKWTAARQAASHVIVVFDADTAESAASIIARISDNIQGRAK